MAKKKRAGRKGQYHKWITDEGLTKVQAWARDGLTEKQIAGNIGVSEQTLNVWKNRFPELVEALKKGKEVIDFEVENKLLQRAMGFEYEEVETFVEEVDGVQKKKIRRTKKHALPDTTAQIFWLKNRKRAEWRDRHEMQHSGDVSVTTRTDAIREYLESDDV